MKELKASVVKNGLGDKTMKAGARLPIVALSAILLLTEGGYGEVFCRDLIVGAWNIQWLGKPWKRSWIGKNVPQKAEDIAGYVKASKVQLLALEEICGDGAIPGNPTNETLDAVIGMLNEGTGASWTYRLFPKRKPDDGEQHTGLMWNAKIVTAVGEPFRIAVKVPPQEPDKPFHWKRWPHAMKFSAGEGKTDFVIIPVHMKSNSSGKEAAKRQRAEEAEQLTEALKDVKNRFSDSDIVIIGDTNVLESTEDAVKTYVKAGFKDLNAGDEPTMAMGSAPFDRAFVTVNQPELSRRKVRVFRPDWLTPMQFRKDLSDHYMVTIKIGIQPDDD
ncbi:MAG: endonuclease/exonuclease/phosphatase family protein [Pseudomonadota bacterium]